MMEQRQRMHLLPPPTHTFSQWLLRGGRKEGGGALRAGPRFALCRNPAAPGAGCKD